ncbi:hypothetical protein EUX98_g9455 [Antrodiella citrinella]|uniref:Protein kinase domain-containing protein n=1 Tax=Antrodiella citrinella TaxID=2447956 RepID=A0A4S4LYM2_9APHY|nr:hypothetical protein EUX98_g9455 [Antrodiella citrinella]
MSTYRDERQEDSFPSYASGDYTGLGALHPSEILWRDRYVYLKENGYLLRPRYKPDWKPSWLGREVAPFSFEDFVMCAEDIVLDATPTGQKYRVSIKVVPRTTQEITIARMLSSKDVNGNPNNHCVPVLDVLPDPLDPSNALLVMPYLRPFNDPPFEVIEEVMDFIRQTLEGLSFIHSQGVAHRDCSTRNIMMDGRPLFPEDHHPVHTHLSPDVRHQARCLSRMEKPVKYYYIDFGMSTYFKEGESPYVLGAKGADLDAPELSNEYPYNPYMLDIFILGHVYEAQILQASDNQQGFHKLTWFSQTYHGLSFLEPLITAMMHAQPERRPTASAALRMFSDIRRNLNHTHLHWRLRGRSETGTERVVYDTISAAKMGFSLVRKGLMGT